MLPFAPLLLPPFIAALCVALGTKNAVETALRIEDFHAPAAFCLACLMLDGRLAWLIGGVAALLAAWAAARACCDPMMRTADQLIPRSLLPPSSDAAEASRQCDILTPYAALGRRAVIVCCALTLAGVLLCAIRPRNVLDAWRCTLLAALFATIVCNEDAWDWRALSAPVVAGIVQAYVIRS